MPSYTFRCEAKRHDPIRHGDRDFELFLHIRGDKNVDQHECQCGGLAKRNLAVDLRSINTLGMTPIHPTDSKNHIGKELEFAFGKFKRNPDGTEDHNHAPFRDTGELSKYMNGQNDLGEPVLDDNGKPRRRADGSMIRQGAKLIKYGANRTPSKTGLERKRHNVPSAWVDEKAASQANGLNRAAVGRPSEYRSPERRK